MTNTEPALTANGVVAAISTIVVALIAFGVIDWTPEQQAAFMAATLAILGIVLPIVSAFWIRLNSTSLADPKVTTETGTVVRLVRADTHQPTPQATMRAAKAK